MTISFPAMEARMTIGFSAMEAGITISFTAMEAGITKVIKATYPMMKIRIFHCNGSWNNYKYSVMKMTRVSPQWKRE